MFVTWSDAELGHFHSVRATGGRSTRLTRQPGHYLNPRFSPDGQSIVYEVTDGGFLTSPDWSIDTGIFSIPVRGGDARQITDDGSNPHFGARNDRLYITRNINEATALVSIDLNGKPRTRMRAESI